ncbi:hypothetical protein KFE25_003230 [Diacronema lutheri]|uniref:Major facilitator superfamily (MFS) profile domain-containing protein n=2 Tax=Diacronema lutheri TaxID=2081491 RepID=A0A8J6C756_DIALT|nr:hypothetical protein KFE25_003230 [Diacronema lutheri]
MLASAHAARRAPGAPSKPSAGAAFAPMCTLSASFASVSSSSESDDSSSPSPPRASSGASARAQQLGEPRAREGPGGRTARAAQPEPARVPQRRRPAPARAASLGAVDAGAPASGGAHKPARARAAGSARVVEFAARADEGGCTGGAAQCRAFILVYAAYVGLLVSRKNYGFWLPHAMAQLDLPSPKDVAVVGSAFEIASGYGALLNGFLIDSFDPMLGLSAALAASCVANLLLSRARSLPLMALLWGANGAAQSFGWPCVSRVFLRAFPDPNGRGLYYSLLSTSQNFGAALSPLLVSSALELSTEPRAAFWLPAAVSGALALTLLVAATGAAGARARAPPAPPAPAAGAAAAPARVDARRRGGRVLCGTLCDWRLWAMGGVYFAIGIVRSCLTDWSPVFLREEKGLSVLAASRCLCAFELGGFCGSIGAGRLSDRWCGGRRGPVVATCTALLCPALFALATARSEPALVGTYVALGGLAFPVHVLLGLASREVVEPAASSTAGGLVKFAAQMGASSAGYPLGVLQRERGWHAVLCLLAVGTAAAGALGSTLWWTVARVDAPALPLRDERQPHKRKGG